jgi:hypothetical protein
VYNTGKDFHFHPQRFWGINVEQQRRAKAPPDTRKRPMEPMDTAYGSGSVKRE